MSRGILQVIGTGIFGNTRLARSAARATDKVLGYLLVGLGVAVLTAVSWFLSQPMWVRALVVAVLGGALVAWLDHRFGDRGRSALRSRYGRGGRRTAVYYLRDRDAVLLYVGIAYDPEQRWEQHRADRSKRHWIWRVEDRQVEWYDSREQAKAVETATIKGERGPRPYFNVAEAVEGAA